MNFVLKVVWLINREIVTRLEDAFPTCFLFT